MTYYVAGLPYSANDIYHHGIKGQKWGNRRFQNKDGSLTEAGKSRYGSSEGDDDKTKAIQQIKSMYSQLKDRETSKELDYLIGKVKAGSLSAKEAIDAAKNAIEMDHERVKYLAQQKQKQAKKDEKQRQQKEKQAKKSSGPIAVTVDSRRTSLTAEEVLRQYANRNTSKPYESRSDYKYTPKNKISLKLLRSRKFRFM